MNYVYLVECKDGSLYAGWTNDLADRIRKHNLGKGAKYTRARYPVTLKYVEEYEKKEEAMKREYDIKQLTREQKVELIKAYEDRIAQEGTRDGRSQ